MDKELEVLSEKIKQVKAKSISWYKKLNQLERLYVQKLIEQLIVRRTFCELKWRFDSISDYRGTICFKSSAEQHKALYKIISKAIGAYVTIDVGNWKLYMDGGEFILMSPDNFTTDTLVEFAAYVGADQLTDLFDFGALIDELHRVESRVATVRTTMTLVGLDP